MAPRKTSPYDRVMARAERQPNGCLAWMGRPSSGGYGQVTADDHAIGVHVAVWEHHYGPVPAGMQVEHKCHTADASCAGGPNCQHRRCCEIDHLELLTPRDNTLRSGNPAALNAAKTHCRNGHEFTAENTLVDPPGSAKPGQRRCRTCHRDRMRDRKSAVSAARQAAGLTTRGTVPK